MPAWKKLLQSGAVINADLSGTAGITSANIADGTIDNDAMAANSIDSDQYVDGSIDLVHLQTGTDGELITWNASGNPAAVAVGSSGQVLTSAGAGQPPAFATAAGDIEGVTAGDGLSGGGSSGAVSLALDLVSNGGLEIQSAELSVAQGISQYDVPQFAASVADNDFLKIDGTTVEGRSAAEVLSDIGASAAAGSSSVVTTGALNSGSITSGFGTIDTGSSNITTTGTITAGNLTVSGTTTTISSTSLVIEDKAIILGTNSAGTDWGGGSLGSSDSAIIFGAIIDSIGTTAIDEGIKLVCSHDGFQYDTSDDRALLKVTHIDHATFATANDADAGVYAHIGVAALLLDTTQGALIYDSAAGRPSDGTVVFAGDDLYVYIA